jgi:hypothetical protein
LEAKEGTGKAMSFYNIIKGDKSPSISKFVVDTLDDYCLPYIPRYRDAWIDKNEWDEYEFIVLTRTGGGNREEYEEDNNELAKHPLYLYYNDDDFDSTYAEFHFKVPDNEKPIVELLYSKTGKEPSLFDKTQAAIKSIGDSMEAKKKTK